MSRKLPGKPFPQNLDLHQLLLCPSGSRGSSWLWSSQLTNLQAEAPTKIPLLTYPAGAFPPDLLGKQQGSKTALGWELGIRVSLVLKV